jgi:hypothetical protein
MQVVAVVLQRLSVQLLYDLWLVARIGVVLYTTVYDQVG